MAVVLVGVHVLGARGPAASPSGKAAPAYVAIWLDDDASSAQLDQLRSDAQASRDVVTLEYVSRDASPPTTRLPAGLRPDPPTAYLLLRVRDARAAGALRDSFTGRPGVRAVKTSA